MTHGAGGFSSGGGGGGGFGGGGGGGFHMHHHHSDSDGEGCDCCCFFVVCGINILGFIFCIRKMSRYVRIALLWTYVTIAVLTIGLLLSLTVFGTNKYQSAPTDMRIVDKNINNAFCQSISINSTDSFQAYLMDEEPAADPDKVEQFNTTYFMSIEGNRYEYWGFYFLEESTAVIVASGGATMYVIKGNSNLQTWIDGQGDCSGCYIDKGVTIPTYTYNLKVTERDDYFFVFFADTFLISIQADFYIRRTLFDVSEATSSCSFHRGGKACYFDLSLSPSQIVVYHNGRTTTTDQSIDMWTSCHSRIWMYVVVFCLIPIPLALIVTFLFWKYCKDDKTQEMSALSADPDVPYNKF